MRIACLLAAASVLAAAPALAQVSAPSSVSASAISAPTPGLVTIDGKSANIYLLTGGDLIADVVTPKGQPAHLGPARYAPLHMQTDAAGLLNLSGAASGMFGGKPVRVPANVTIGGRRLDLNGARITLIGMPACADGKPKSSRIDIEISFETMKIAQEKAPIYAPPVALTTCAVTLGDLKTSDISSIDGLTIAAMVEPDTVGQMRDYAKTTDESARPSDIHVFESATQSAVSTWARQYIVLGDASPAPLKITYAGASGATITLAFGNTLPHSVSADQGRGVHIQLATEKPSLSK